MGMGVSLVLIAAGAILAWAVSAEASGVDLQTVGVILLVWGLWTWQWGDPSSFISSGGEATIAT